MANNGAAILGYAAFGFLADAYGRKPVTIAYVALAFLSVPMVFLWAHDLTFILSAAAFSGIFVSGQYTWMAAGCRSCSRPGCGPPPRPSCSTRRG